jgi:3-methylcrotonyl-CoA carboxylase alpha subunit
VIVNYILDSASAKGAIKVPMPSLVVEVKVKVGSVVKIGEAVVVLESMKTETVLRADVDGKVTAVDVAKERWWQKGRSLLRLRLRAGMRHKAMIMTMVT